MFNNQLEWMIQEVIKHIHSVLNLTRDISESTFRICAIREVFEETGVLIATENLEGKYNKLNEWRTTVQVDYLPDVRNDNLHRKIPTNLLNFINL